MPYQSTLGIPSTPTSKAINKQKFGVSEHAATTYGLHAAPCKACSRTRARGTESSAVPKDNTRNTFHWRRLKSSNSFNHNNKKSLILILQRVLIELKSISYQFDGTFLLCLNVASFEHIIQTMSDTLFQIPKRAKLGEMLVQKLMSLLDRFDEMSKSEGIQSLIDHAGRQAKDDLPS